MPASRSFGSLLGPLARPAAVILAATALTASACATGAGSTSSTTHAAGPGARPSPGCDAGPDVALTQPRGTLETEEGDRVFAIHALDADLGLPQPLIVELHPPLGNIAGQVLTSRSQLLGQSEGYIALYAEARELPDFWDTAVDGVDVSYILALVDHVTDRACVDEARIYLSGFSEGGILALAAACADPDRFAAVAVVSAMVPIPDCGPPRPMPLVAIHGTADATIHFGGGMDQPMADLTGYGGGPPVPELVAAWAVQHNGCDAGNVTEDVATGVTNTSWTCPEDGSTVLYVVDGGGHTWPGSEAAATAVPEVFTTLELDATAVIWGFLSRHARP